MRHIDARTDRDLLDPSARRQAVYHTERGIVSVTVTEPVGALVIGVGSPVTVPRPTVDAVRETSVASLIDGLSGHRRRIGWIDNSTAAVRIDDENINLLLLLFEQSVQVIDISDVSRIPHYFPCEFPY